MYTAVKRSSLWRASHGSPEVVVVLVSNLVYVVRVFFLFTTAPLFFFFPATPPPAQICFPLAVPKNGCCCFKWDRDLIRVVEPPPSVSVSVATLGGERDSCECRGTRTRDAALSLRCLLRCDPTCCQMLVLPSAQFGTVLCCDL